MYIILFCRFECILFLYIVFGILVQIFVRKKSGKKVIPNHDFWVAVPSYIKVRYTNHGDQYYNTTMHQHLVNHRLQKENTPPCSWVTNLSSKKSERGKSLFGQALTMGNYSIKWLPNDMNMLIHWFTVLSNKRMTTR